MVGRLVSLSCADSDGEVNSETGGRRNYWIRLDAFAGDEGSGGRVEMSHLKKQLGPMMDHEGARERRKKETRRVLSGRTSQSAANFRSW